MRILLFFIASFLFSLNALAQDRIIFRNGDEINGEIKTLDKGVLEVSTPYDDSNFKIDWGKVIDVRSDREFFVLMRSGNKDYVSFRSSEKIGYIFLQVEGQRFEVPINDIVMINLLEEEFSDRFEASISAGLNITKANNTRQFSTRGTIRYYARDWSTNANIDVIRSTQDNTEAVRRTNGSVNFSYLFYQNWFASLRNEFLSNTEQSLRLRNTHTLAIGNLIIRTNKLYLSGSIGASYNREDYTNATEVFNSSEAYIGAEFNAYDVGDISLLTKLAYKPSFTSAGRYRIDFNVDLKYDLPLDFFIKLGYTLNFDSKPPNGGPNDDFVFQTTVGWDF